jgi:hypothetical protein
MAAKSPELRMAIALGRGLVVNSPAEHVVKVIESK